VLNVPAAFIALVDEQRDFYLSSLGFDEPLATKREFTGDTLCQFTIEGTEPLVIPDTRTEPICRKVPAVETSGVAAYLGAPIVLMSGEVIGAFCVTDNVVREWTAAQIQSAKDLASLVVAEIELRQTALDFRDRSPGEF